ncbi:helix-turn-helix transcriptional regulator [Thauera linaloolentis]|uniref:Regulatory protein LuxR n=1 Tax=Thauera linaloolentis (strain DSM 12138 / JCM 21573 / CCUG 41526 / CIP 105981 / IAM 15112 / NBRC 102519 / 47Lol) TaxID=1123367 RepID=N6YYR4_THAL4|nr:LuxR family transcriptional regulator [Thauera linaloolentis]ENO87283.1 regulatory protein LuxR [Thauera linaloolentis 47Lol = DSM 12138]
MAASWDTRFRERLAAHPDLAGAGALLAEYADTLGWERAAFHADLGQTRLPLTENGEFVAVAMGWSADYVAHWVNDRRALTCPVSLRCTRSMDAFLWDCDPDSETWHREALSAAQRDILLSYRDCADGAVTVPVHRPGGKTAYVSWFGRGAAALRDRFRRTYRETYLISHAFITHADALESARRRGRAQAAADRLSPREIECLGWAAQGKTEEDIALILGRSRETVHFHLNNALRKLDACNRTHAVAIACSLGLIRLF